MMNNTLSTSSPPGGHWPDQLQPSEPARSEQLLQGFWQELAGLPALLQRDEQLLAGELVTALRNLVLEMMLALNGIRRPVETTHLNLYLSPSQRAALQKTLILPSVSSESWIGCAVALVVIYRWYAPQLVARFGCAYPQALEEATLAALQADLADWPLTIVTD